MARPRRYFGNVRRRESGRYQARYRTPDGRHLSAPQTFARKADAARWLMLKEAEIERGEWIDPDHAAISFGNYSRQWLDDRVLKIRTRELYGGLLRNHLLPAFGKLSLADIDEAAVRRWRKERLEAGKVSARPFGPVTVAKAYRLLHAILETASGDQLIRRNPCRIEGAGKEESAEREVIALPVVLAVAGALPVRYRALVLLGTFGSLRWGELVGLRRENIDLDACVVRVRETTAELDSGGLVPDTPKSRAGRRTVSFPPELVPELGCHLDRFAGPGERSLVFTGTKGAPLRRSNFRPIWNAATEDAGVPGLHFHDLRHVGGTLAAATGASHKELMARLGHSSTRAAMIYQHATRDRDEAIAKALGGFMRQVRSEPPSDASGQA
ncbi:MAG: site-specific integrase [Actinobacteria bacterium]|nr:site-specific integrase [Actinomycetota bacterium]